MIIKKRLDFNFKKGLFIIHNDADGRGCEILSEVYMPSKMEFKVIEANGGDEALREALSSENEYDLIMMGDCSFCEDSTLKAVLEYINEGNQFFLIDHHQNAMNYNEYDWAFVSVIEDGVKNSGTELVYQFLTQQISESLSPRDFVELRTEEIKSNFNPKEFVELIRSYDTWDWFKTNYQRPVDLVALFNFDKEGFVKDMIYNLKNGRPVFDEKQETILSIVKKCNENYIKETVKYIEFIKHENLTAGLIVANQLQGLIANKAFEKYPELDFLVFIVNPSKLSFRSTDDRIDCSVIAKSLGGNGHRNACGCSIPKEIQTAIKEHLLG